MTTTDVEPDGGVMHIRPGADATQQGAPITRGLRVLIADDYEDLGDIMRRMVEKLGHVIDEAADGQKAIDAIMARRYDLLLLDLSMPRMSGIDVARWLHARPEHRDGMTVAVVSASAYDERPILNELGISLFSQNRFAGKYSPTSSAGSPRSLMIDLSGDGPYLVINWLPPSPTDSHQVRHE